jgi:hypothetical protein
MNFGMWWCLRWHRQLDLIAHVSEQSDRVKCAKCGREYGVNHDVRAVLPWSEVAGFYARRDVRRAALTEG